MSDGTIIYFRCAGCRHELQIDASAAGHITPCPTCGRRLTVPNRSRLSPIMRHRLLVGAASAVVCLLVLGALAFLTSGAHPSTHVHAASRTMRLPTSMATPQAAVDAAESGSGHDSMAVLENANQRLAEETLQLKQQMESVMGWVMNNFRGKFPLAEKFVHRLHVPPVTDDFHLHPELAEILNLRGDEQALVNDAFVASAGNMAEIEASMMTVTQSQSGRVTIFIPAYEKEGGALRDDLYSALETTLGAGRFDRMLDISETELVQDYHYFGAATRTMIMEMAYPTNGVGQPELLIRDGWIVPNGDNQKEVHLTESRVTSLPKAYAAYRSVLPPSFVGLMSP